jgi:hypothetical protein
MRWGESGILHVKAGDLLTRVRLRLRDMQKKNFSDYELMIALNDAVQMLWIALAENFSTVPVTKTILPVVGGSAPLPRDFYSLVSLQKGAVVNGFFVESDESGVEIEYNRLPSPAINAGDALEIPVSMILDTVEITAALLTEGTAGAVNVAMSSAQRISEKREYSAIPDWRPFS